MDGLNKILIAVMAFAVAATSLLCINYYQFQSETELKSLGFKYSKECKLIETNIDNGLFSANTNKIECNGVIDNVNMDDYNTAISAYQDSLK